jgi:hypothetical protein
MRRLFVAALVGVLLTLTPGQAFADPAPPGPGTTLDWPDMGLPAGITLVEMNAVQNYTIPVPAGLTPTALTGVVNAPPAPGIGRLEVDTGDGVYLGAVDVPARAGDRPIPFSVPLTGAVVRDGRLEVGLIGRYSGEGPGHCNPVPPLSVTGLAVNFSGEVSAPRTIDVFFPPVLKSLAFYVDPAPTRAEEQSVLQLTAALVAQYDPLSLTVATQPLPRTAPLPDLPPSPTERAIVVREAPTAGISVSDAGRSTALTLSGTDRTLPVQVDLFARNLSALAQVPSATVTAGTGPELRTAKTYTFDELGIAVNGAVLGQRDLSFGLAQDKLGGPLGAVEVHLVGRYTPVLADAIGTLSIIVSGTTLSTLRLGDSGVLDTTFRIPPEEITRNIGVRLQVAYDPRIVCSAITPNLDFSIDPRSTVTVDSLDDAAGGFAALPTAFLNGFAVALQHDDLRSLDYAVRAVAGIAGMASTTLAPRLVTLDQAKSSGLSTLIVGDSTAVRELGLNPPLRGDGPSIAAELARTAPGTLTAEVPAGVGSIQVFADRDNNRTVVLITTTADWSLVDPLWDRLADTHLGGWPALIGDVLVSGAAGNPRNITLRDGGAKTFLAQDSGGWQVWLWLGLFVLLLAVAAGVGYLILRHRRS